MRLLALLLNAIVYSTIASMFGGAEGMQLALTTALILGGSAVLGAGAQAYGASQTPEGVKQHELSATGFMPGADPLLSALSQQGLLGLGQFDPNIYRQSSPVQQLLNQALQSGQLDQRDYRLLKQAAALSPEQFEAIEGLKGPEAKRKLRELGFEGMAPAAFSGLKKQLTSLALSGGYGSVGDLFQANADYLGKLPGLQAQYQPIADQMRSGLLASQGRIGQYLQDLPNLLTGEANPFIDQLREEALITSEKYGVNPYQFLEQARSTALQRALQLIGGEQAVTGAQQQAALGPAQLRQQGGAQAANLGAGQAAMLAQALQSQQAGQAAQAQQWGQLGNTLGAYGLIGADIMKGPGTQG